MTSLFSDSEIPSYLMAGDAHTALASGEETTDYSVAQHITNFTRLSIGSGVNQLYNIIPTVANWLPGKDYELRDYHQVVASYDEDLSKYYEDHKLGIDVGGFILSSFVPGMGAVKVLNMGQVALRGAIAEGKFGASTGRALGLLAPSREKYVSQAIKEMGTSGSVFKLSEANTLKALAAGAGQNAYEGMAFMAAVNATMYNSPVLEDRDVGDLVYDTLVWGGVGGAVIGGAIAGVVSSYSIKRGLVGIEKEVRPYRQIDMPAPNATESDRILFNAYQLADMPPLPEEASPIFARASKEAKIKRDRLLLEIRGDFQKIAGNDEILAQAMYDNFLGAPIDKNVANYLDSLSISRITKTTALETKLDHIRNEIKKNLGAKLTPEDFELFNNATVTFVKLRGEGVGNVLTERPYILNLADHLKKGETIKLEKDGIRVGSKKYANDNNPHRAFNILAVDHLKVEARYTWAEMLPKWDPAEEITVHATDIPLLTKAVRDGMQKIKVIPESGYIDQAVTLNSADEILAFVRNQKAELATRMANMQIMPRDVDTLIDLLKSRLGINFNMVSDPGGGYNGFFHRVLAKSGVIDVQADVIALERFNNLARPLMKIVQTLKHEEGHSIFQALLDARGVSRQNFETMYPLLRGEVAALSKKARPSLWKMKGNQAVKDYRESAHEMFADAFAYLSKNPELLPKYPEFKRFAGHLVRPIPQDILDSLAVRVAKPTQDEIAKILDVESGLLSGVIRDKGWFARDLERAEHLARMEATGTRAREQVSDPHLMPTYAKIVGSSTRLNDTTGADIDAMALFRARAKEWDARADRTAADSIGEVLPNIEDRVISAVVSAGAKFAAFSNGNPGSLESIMQYVGQRVHNIIKKTKEATSEVFMPTLSKMAVQREDAIKFSMLNEKMRSLPQRYVLSEDGTELVYKVRKEGDVIPDGLPESIPLEGELIQELVANHIAANARRLAARQKRHSDLGLFDKTDLDTFYPIPRDPADTPFFAFVIDNTQSGGGHSKMIYANTQESLELMKARILTEVPGVKVLTKPESEEYFKAHGQYSFERTINENHIDIALARRGISSSPMPLTDPQRIVTQFLEWHHKRDAAMIREAVSHKYYRQFETLRSYAEPSIQAAKSKFGYISPLSYAENSVNNPASDLIKLALDISKMDEFPIWSNINKTLDAGYSAAIAKIRQVWSGATSTESLAEINAILREQGYNGPVVDEVLYRAMNGTVPRGELTSLVNKANGLIATFALRADPLNALNNIVGGSVLLGTETKAVISAIMKGDKDAVGELAALANITVPGTGDSIFSATKLIANSINRFHTDKAGREWMRKHGFITSITDQYDQSLDMLALRVGDTRLSYEGRINDAFRALKKAGDTAEGLTGNRLAEEFNRFVAADVMKQMTDVAVRRGLMDDRTALSYINTFVNRTQGNYLASQRPLLFQGPIGQAIGLFQTYQFNLIQQLLRHIGDGNLKNVGTMMALQGTVFGMNGLPAFNAINTHIIGNAKGNENNTDLYDVVRSGAGKEGGDWLLYGALSNLPGLLHPDLKVNMYTRGDINPRSITLVPTDPAKIPIVQASARIYAEIKEGLSKTGMGADVWGTFLRGLEQNGVSRPLAGMAQVLEGMTREDGKVVSMSSQGNILMSHDLISLASLVRIAGGKPMDEAIMQQYMFGVNTYKQKDLQKRRLLGEAIKVSILSGDEPDEEQINQFAEVYASTGGKQNEFAQFMALQHRNASVSQSNQLMQKLNNPYSRKMQSLMGGYSLEDLESVEE